MDAEIEPGVTMVDLYVRNKQLVANGEPLPVPHESLRKLLEPVYGVWAYQESLMTASGILAGFTPGGQDALRSATSKKKKELIEALKFVFIYGSAAAVEKLVAYIEERKQAGLDPKSVAEYEKALKAIKAMANNPIPGGLAKGHSLEFLEKLYEQWLTFSGYSFNLSHSAAYALISYWTAWLKVHHPAQFIGALLTADADDGKKMTAHLSEARRFNIPILPPSVNHSGSFFELFPDVDSWAIRFGLSGIKGIKNKVVEEIISQRPYDSFADFISKVKGRTIDLGIVRTLIQAGAFDEFEPNRYELWEHYHDRIRKDSPKAKVAWDRYEPTDWKPEIGWHWEKELMGNYVSGHPLEDLPSVDWETVSNGNVVEVGGIISNQGFRVFLDKNKNEMAVGRIDTLSGIPISFLIFSSDWAKLKPLFAANATIILKGKKNGSRDSLLVSSASSAKRRRVVKPKPSGRPTAAPGCIVSDPLLEPDPEDND
jgi:DNA polymerase-3 subunit alpha